MTFQGLLKGAKVSVREGRRFFLLANFFFFFVWLQDRWQWWVRWWLLLSAFYCPSVPSINPCGSPYSTPVLAGWEHILRAESEFRAPSSFISQPMESSAGIVNIFPMPPFCPLSFSAHLSNAPHPVLFYDNWGGGRDAGAAVMAQLAGEHPASSAGFLGFSLRHLCHTLIA